MASGEEQNSVEVGDPSSLFARSGRVDCSQSVPGDLGTFYDFERPAKVKVLWSWALAAVIVVYAHFSLRCLPSAVIQPSRSEALGSRSSVALMRRR